MSKSAKKYRKREQDNGGPFMPGKRKHKRVERQETRKKLKDYDIENDEDLIIQEKEKFYEFDDINEFIAAMEEENDQNKIRKI